MSKDTGEWQLTTNHERIRELADERGAVPRRTETSDGADVLEFGTKSDDGKRISWEAFFDRFDDTQQVLRYREFESEGDDLEVVDREDVNESTDKPYGVESEQVATSDTGEHEPVVYNRTESETADQDVDDASTASTGDTERTEGAAAGLVLDEIHEKAAGFGGGGAGDERLVFQNDGEMPIDLSGWTVRNDSGRTYEFSPGTSLKPGEQLTLHSGTGEDADNERYWNAEESIWGGKRNTVTVETAAGERVLREPYET